MLFSDFESVSDCVFFVILKLHWPKCFRGDALNGHIEAGKSACSATNRSRWFASDDIFFICLRLRIDWATRIPFIPPETWRRLEAKAFFPKTKQGEAAFKPHSASLNKKRKNIVSRSRIFTSARHCLALSIKVRQANYPNQKHMLALLLFLLLFFAQYKMHYEDKLLYFTCQPLVSTYWDSNTLSCRLRRSRIGSQSLSSIIVRVLPLSVCGYARAVKAL
jgi:hypothetical protein